MTMSTATTDARSIPTIGHAEATALAEEEYRRFADALGQLADDDWTRPTDCEGWTVRDMAGHVLGAMRAAASVREQASQQIVIRKRVKETGDPEVDVMTALQIERTADLAPAEVVAECASLVRPAAIGRKRTPAPLRRLMKIHVVMGTLDETWRLGYLVDTILTRDIFMHRIDLARAIDGDVDLSGDHTRRIVADIVGEWARRHGKPFELTLTGEAGGHFTSAGDESAGQSESRAPEVIEMDAIEFCRTLSGRENGSGLLSTEVPF